MQNLAQFFLKNTKTYSNRVAYEEFIKGKYNSYTYRELRKKVLALAGYLKKKGFSRDKSKIGILAKNSINWPVVYFAGHVLGIPVVPLDPMLNPKDNIHFLRHSETDILFTDADIYEQMDLDLAPNLNIKEIILSDGGEYAEEGVSSLLDIFNENPIPSQPAVTNELEIESDDRALIIYTSGTTGTPKGVVLTHGNLMHQAVAIDATIEFNDDDVFIGILPLFHAFPSAACMLAPLDAGSKVVFLNSLKATNIVKVLKEKKITIMVGVPALFESLRRAIERKIGKASLLKKALIGTSKGISKMITFMNFNPPSALFKGLVKKAGMETMRLMVSGGAPLMPKTAQFFEMLGIEFVQGYGLTETSPVLTVNYRTGVSNESVGKAIKGVELRIKNINEEGIGEIEARGDNIMEGYYKNPQATEKVFDGKWLKTGDMGYIGEKDCLFIKGRNKNVIVSSAGKNIYPEEIEELISQSDYILETMVFGRKISDDNAGEKVEALVYPDYDSLDDYFKKEGIAENEEDIKELISREVKKYTRDLPAYKKVKNIKIQSEEFQKTSTRKIKRYLYTE